MTEHVFTFGYGQVCPYTGQDLGDHYAVIVAEDPDHARDVMRAFFGWVWSFQYDSVERATRGEQFHMVEHVRIEVPSYWTPIPRAGTSETAAPQREL